MTNTRLTDPEVLEQRYPVLLETFQIRRNSGGKGKWNGGDGLNRILRFLEPMDVSFLCGRRVVAPSGLEGGQDGSVGNNFLKKAGHDFKKLPGRIQLDCQAGDAVFIQTPGGGGYGQP